MLFVKSYVCVDFLQNVSKNVGVLAMLDKLKKYCIYNKEIQVINFLKCVKPVVQ